MIALLPTLLLCALAARTGPADASHLYLGDFDGDGLPDLFACGLGGEGRLLRNAGDGEFVDVTLSSGIVAPAARAAEWQDVDLDGDLDLVVLAEGRPLALWLNQGGGAFTDETLAAGLGGEEPDLELRFVDLDGEGGPDLLRRRPSGEELYLNLGGRFQPVHLGAPGGLPTPSQPAGAGLGVECTKAIFDLANPGSCIQASSSPVLGTLYPISVNWYVDPTGRIGLGTTAPSQRLEAIGNIRASGQLQALTIGLPPLVVNSSFKVSNLNVDLLDGLDSSAFSQLGGSIEGAEITDATITADDLAPGSVTAEELAAGAVGSAALADGAVSASALQDASVATGKLQGGAVTSSKLADASVTTAKLALGAVGGAQVLDGSLTGADIASNSVDGSRIANGSIAYTKLASPLAGTTSGAILYVDNNGTGTQGIGVYAETSSSGDSAVEASALNTGAGVTYGVKALSASAGGFGVWGRANHGSGTNTGVAGETFSTAGVGVRGTNHATSGLEAHGVVGTTASSSGRGVSGTASSTSGAAYGVWGETSSSNGAGVRGVNLATSGTATAVFGRVAASGGRGVYGDNTANTGDAVGVRGSTSSPVGYAVFASGNLGASGVKSFIQPHPSDPTREIRFVCLEGNEAGTYFRGRVQVVDGRAEVLVPEDFRLVSEADGLTCQLTVVGAPAVGWVESIDLERLVLRANVDVELHYLVHGVRRGFAGFETIRPNTSFVPEVAGRPYGAQYPAGLRRILVENGTLKADFTPDEALAASLGRELRPPGADGE